MSDPEIVMSPLCREITGDSTKIQIDIYRTKRKVYGQAKHQSAAPDQARVEVIQTYV